MKINRRIFHILDFDEAPFRRWLLSRNKSTFSRRIPFHALTIGSNTHTYTHMQEALIQIEPRHSRCFQGTHSWRTRGQKQAVRAGLGVAYSYFSFDALSENPFSIRMLIAARGCITKTENFHTRVHANICSKCREFACTLAVLNFVCPKFFPRHSCLGPFVRFHVKNCSFLLRCDELEMIFFGVFNTKMYSYMI